MQRRRRRSSGFTIIEMVVATVLLAVGVVAASVCIGSAAKATGLSANYNTASLLAEERFANLVAQPDQLTGGDQQGDFGDQHPGFSWQQTIEPTDYTSLMKVTVTITWDRGSRSEQFVSYEPVPQTTDTSTTGAPSSTSGTGGGTP